jgi:hypothetical protein
MRIKKRKALEAAGWKFGDAADFLEMSDEERQFLDTGAKRAVQCRASVKHEQQGSPAAPERTKRSRKR